MVKNDEKMQKMIHDQVDKEVMNIKYRIMSYSCRTSIIALLGIASLVGNWVMANSERAFVAMYVLVYGDKPK